MISYSQANDLYNKIKKPPRSHYWRFTAADNAKPLRGVGERHKSIHKMDNGVIYFRLYRTNVATFIPNDDNTYTVVMRYYASPTTQKFMREFGLNYAFQKTDRGLYANIPYEHVSQSDFASAVLTYNADDALITDPLRSWHPEVATKVSSVADKQYRAQIREALKPLITLGMYTIDTHRAYAQAYATKSYAAPFFSVGSMWDKDPCVALRTLRSFVWEQMRVSPHTLEAVHILTEEPLIEQFAEAMPAFLTMFVSKAAMNVFDKRREQNPIIPSWELCVEHVLDNIDVDKFGKSIERQMLSWMSAAEGTQKKPVPLFVPRLPTKFYRYNSKCPDLFVNKLSSRMYGLN